MADVVDETEKYSKATALVMIFLTVWLVAHTSRSTSTGEHTQAAQQPSTQRTSDQPKDPIVEYYAQASRSRYVSPTRGADAASPAVRDLIRNTAREYGVTEEEARQALRKGFNKGYSSDDVDRVFGK